ncbi:MAG: hypothetical protein RIM99_12895 [Cyclobacteriaceae bacterium]
MKYLREFGWEPIVYVPSNAHYPYLDRENEKDIPQGITILRRPIIEPFKMFKFLTGRGKDQPLNSIVQVREKKSSFLDKIGIWIRGNFFIPDARALWIKPSVKFLLSYLKENPVDAIFTDGPPHTNTYIANKLKQKTDIPWLSDYQDPWTQVDYYSMLLIGKRADRIHKSMEQECFKNADRITIASPSWKRDLEDVGARNVEVIYYGYDESDFQGLKKEPSEYFDIVHIGLLGIDRYPEDFFQVLESLNDPKIRLVIAGQVDVEVQKGLENLKNVTVDFRGTIPRKEALQLAMNADLLLLPINKAENAEGRLPGKLYEYLRTYNPILGLGSISGDSAQIIEQTSTGSTVAYDDKKSQEEFLAKLMSGTLSHSPDRQQIGSFSNKNQTKKIAQHLDGIVASEKSDKD